MTRFKEDMLFLEKVCVAIEFYKETEKMTLTDQELLDASKILHKTKTYINSASMKLFFDLQKEISKNPMQTIVDRDPMKCDNRL